MIFSWKTASFDINQVGTITTDFKNIIESSLIIVIDSVSYSFVFCFRLWVYINSYKQPTKTLRSLKVFFELPTWLDRPNATVLQVPPQFSSSTGFKVGAFSINSGLVYCLLFMFIFARRLVEISREFPPQEPLFTLTLLSLCICIGDSHSVTSHVGFQL